MIFFDEQGLIKANSKNLRDENGVLFTLEFIILSLLKNISCTQQKAALEAAIDEMRVYAGIFAKTPYDLAEGIIRPISHDNLTTLVCFSKLMGLSDHKDIWELAKSKQFRYDNTKPESPGWRFLHPRDIIFFGMCNNILWNLAFPALFLIATISCLGKDTSGKLLIFCRCKTLKNNILMKLLFKWCSLLIKTNFRSWNEVFKTYFPEVGHPNNILSKEI